MNAKEKLKALCVHEVLYNNEKDEALSGAGVLERDTDREGDTVRAQEGQGSGPSKGQTMGQKLCLKIVGEKVRPVNMMRYDMTLHY
jgi:hypothetical protein